MGNVVRPNRLRAGDVVRVVAPSCSLAMIGDEVRRVASERFEQLGLELTFGRHVETCDDFVSSPIEQRVSDLHEAFADPVVRAVITVIGGYNSNQLLPMLDWDLIAADPKIFCGYSDITALSCSIWAKTGLITFSGPHYSSFGMVEHFEQTQSWFEAALFGEAPVVVQPAATWSDDEWYLHQHDRQIERNAGLWVMSEGLAEGHLVGGNLCTLNLLHGTEYMPDLAGAVVFIEDDFESMPHTFDRDLTSLSQQPGFADIAGLLVGRFQRKVDMTRDRLHSILRNNRSLEGIPILANVDFGHTDPLLTLPVGGRARMAATVGASELEFSW
jgi:muramoyltetrapeptide carboxypeptidase LdcA involved in peptidoglycan recycling